MYGEDNAGTDDGAVSTPSSSPLPHREPTAHSSVEPEDSPTRTPRTPPTSPSTHGDHAGGASPELGSDRLIFEDFEQTRQSRATPASSRESSAGDTQAQSSAAANSNGFAAPKVKRRRKRKSNFDDDEKPASPRLRGGSTKTEGSTAPAAEDDLTASFKTISELDQEKQSEFTHPGCPGKGLPCTHPIYGTPEPLAKNFPGVVYRHQQFQFEGEATEDQVRFVISRMKCVHTKLIHEGCLAVMPAKEVRHRTKYAVLAHSTFFLNGFVKEYCPEFVDLTMDD